MASTPHLYISALPFSPVQSIIYKQFSPKYSNLAQIVDGGEQCWPNLQLTIRGHDSCVTFVTFSPDGKRITSGSEDKTVCLWDAETGLQLASPLTGPHLLCYSSIPSHALLDSNVYIPESDFNVRALLELDSGGWIISPTGHLLLWLPSYMSRPSLYSPYRLFVIGKNTKLDLSKMVHGSKWIECN